MADSIDTRARLSALLEAGQPDGQPAFDEVFPLVYQELHQMARRQLAGGWRQATLDTTGLVHEAYIKLVDDTAVSRHGRAYFFAAAATAMRQVLVDAARRRSRLKRGGGRADVTLDEGLIGVDGFAAELLALDEALIRLAAHYPRQARVVECRFFGGLSIEETSLALEMSDRSVVRDWTMARAWLYRELEERSGA